jgi:hypothetical protein
MMKILPNLFLVLVVITFFLSCKSDSRAYLKGSCAYTPRTCPFNITIKDYTVKDDTVTLNVETTNISDSMELIMIETYSSISIMNDSSLTRGIVNAIRCYDCGLIFLSHNNKSLINCKNCMQFYSSSQDYICLRKGESNILHSKHVITGLKSKPNGYKFTIKYSMSIPEHISNYCPKIWSGKVFAQCEIVK